MKILLLGPNGQLGTDLSRVSREFPKLELIPISRKQLDVAELDKIIPTLSEHNFDILINCTSYHKTDEVEVNGSQAVTINSHAVQKLAEACEIKNAKLIHISTDYVFNGRGNTPYTETDSPAPINVYGATKAMGENLIQSTFDNFYILRVASLFGIAGASGKGGNFVETMLKFGKEKGELKVVNDITMSPTSTKFLANLIFTLIQKEGPNGIYHLVNSGRATWFEFAKRIIEAAGVSAKVIPVTSEQFPTKAKRPEFSVLNNKKFETLFGTIPNWDIALKEYLMEKGHIS